MKPASATISDRITAPPHVAPSWRQATEGVPKLITSRDQSSFEPRIRAAVSPRYLNLPRCARGKLIIDLAARTRLHSVCPRNVNPARWRSASYWVRASPRDPRQLAPQPLVRRVFVGARMPDCDHVEPLRRHRQIEAHQPLGAKRGETARHHGNQVIRLQQRRQQKEARHGIGGSRQPARRSASSVGPSKEPRVGETRTCSKRQKSSIETGPPASGCSRLTTPT